jgi:hypothetical protein
LATTLLGSPPRVLASRLKERIAAFPSLRACKKKHINHFVILTDRTPKLVLLTLDLYKYFMNKVCLYRQDDS